MARRSIAIGPEMLMDVLARQKARKPSVETSLDFIMAHTGHDSDECLIWPFSRFPVGYGKVGIANKVMAAHRVMCAAAHGAPPTADHQAAHSCGNGYGGCIHPKHLRWATPLENSHDKFIHGTVIAGHRHYASALTPEDVSRARSADLSRWGDLSKLARSIGVSTSTIIRLRAGESYRG